MRKRKEQATLERFRELFDLAPVGYAALATDGTIREINHAGSQLLGREPSQLVGCNFMELVARPSIAAFHALLQAAVASADTAVAEVHLAQGAEVHVSMTRVTRDAPSLLVIFERATRTVTAPRARPEVPSRRILIVEDRQDVAESLKFALTTRGHVVEAAHDGRTAILVAQTFRPQVLLCDLGLPDMDGYAVARTFRSDEDLQDTYLVALSGYTRPEDVARSRAAGFAQHLAKPPQLDEIELLLAHVPNALDAVH